MLENVEPGHHTYAVFEPVSGIQYLLDGMTLASRLSIALI